jgi:NAD(P)-dependent dehydrogenase (short-subunit alcohol dehydrogenase family)
MRALVLHASIQIYGPPEFTPDGIESAFAVNYLANFLLVPLLLKSMDREHEARLTHKQQFTRSRVESLGTRQRKETRSSFCASAVRTPA